MHGEREYAIFGLDRAGLVTSWNPVAEHVNGYRSDQIIGRHFSVLYSDEDAIAGVPAAELATAAGDAGVEVESWRVRSDGTRFWADVVITALFDGDQQLLGFSMLTHDITSRRIADVALRESAERSRLMVDSVRDYAILGLDAAGVVTSWNLGAEHIKGYRPEEIIGRHFSVFYVDEDVAAGVPAAALADATRDGSVEADGWRVCKDGSRFWANVVITALYTEDHRLLGFGKVTRDLTVAHQHAQDLLDIAADLRRSQAAALRMAASERAFAVWVSHELRTPTAVIIGFVEEVLEIGGLSEEANELINTAYRNVLRLNQSIDDLLVIGEVDLGTQMMHLTPTDLCPLLDDVGASFRPAARSRDVELTVDHADPLSPALIDPAWFGRALSNIVGNALRFTPNGGSVRVHARPCRPDSLDARAPAIQVLVTNTGSGITASEIARFFERPHPSPAGVASNIGGTRLSLPIAKIMIDAQGGNIAVASTGSGTTFTITVPAAPDPQPTGPLLRDAA